MSDPHVPPAPNREAAERQVDRPLTKALKEHLIALGADLVGIGAVERLREAPAMMQPTRYLRDAASLISIALRVNEAACDLIAESIRGEELPASYHSYQMFTLTIINPQLDRLAYLAAKFLEQRGYRAYPFPANLPHVLKPSAEYPGGPGDISHKHVAVACGLGRIGWHTLLITPQFGTRQKLVSIATTAHLEPDSLCDVELCDRAVADSNVPGRARPRPSLPHLAGASASISEAWPPNTPTSSAGDAAGGAAEC